jgi:hypothetical protein
MAAELYQVHRECPGARTAVNETRTGRQRGKDTILGAEQTEK